MLPPLTARTKKPSMEIEYTRSVYNGIALYGCRSRSFLQLQIAMHGFVTCIFLFCTASTNYGPCLAKLASTYILQYSIWQQSVFCSNYLKGQNVNKLVLLGHITHTNQNSAGRPSSFGRHLSSGPSMKAPGYCRMHCNLNRGEPALSKEFCLSPSLIILKGKKRK